MDQTFEDYLKTADQARINRNLLLVEDALDVLCGKWKLRILMAIVKGCSRYKDILDRNPGLTDKILSQNLRVLLEDCLIEREERAVGNLSRPQVEYRLTAHGRTLRPVIALLARWGDEHRRYVLGEKRCGT